MTDTVLIVEGEDTVLIVEGEERPILLWSDIVTGPPGPAGPPGVSYVHVQASASDTWVVNHNLGVEPTVSLRTVGGVEFEASVIHTNANQFIVYLISPLAGFARCS